MAKRTYSDAEKLAYWRAKAQGGASRSGGGNYSSNRKQYKKSAATFTKITSGKSEGAYAVNAFKKTRTGVIKAVCFPATDEVSESKKGSRYMGYHVTCIDMNTLQSSKYRGIMNIDTRVLVISELGMCITPNGSGESRTGKRLRGYFGKFSK